MQNQVADYLGIINYQTQRKTIPDGALRLLNSRQTWQPRENKSVKSVNESLLPTAGDCKIFIYKPRCLPDKYANKTHSALFKSVLFIHLFLYLYRPVTLLQYLYCWTKQENSVETPCLQQVWTSTLHFTVKIHEIPSSVSVNWTEDEDFSDFLELTAQGRPWAVSPTGMTASAE